LASGSEIETLPARDGVPLAYTSDGQGKPAIVFIHGWTCDHTHWRSQVREFSKSLRVITLDLAGHGASGADRTSWSIDGLADDVAVLVRTLKLKQVVLVGQSMGGSVALAAASKLPGIAIGVVAVDALHNVEFAYSDETVERIVKKFEDDFDAVRTRFLSGFFDDPGSEVLAFILARPNVVDQSAAIALLRDYNKFDGKAAMRAAGVPVRAINTADGFPTAVEINQKHGDFDAVLMPDVGHFLMMEEPAEFNRHLRDIIEKLEAD